MKILVEHNNIEENEIIIRCKSIDEEILHVLALLKSRTQKIGVWKEEKDKLILLSPDSILYAESVDDKTFVYCENEIYQTAFNLGEFEARYEDVGFCRISKAMVINLHRISSLKSRAAGRIEAKIQNGEVLIVSRHYSPILRERLRL